jgi:LuxR family transcriptional regulator, maltose regulon positive regulatory protein
MRSADSPLIRTKVLPPKVGTSVRRERLLRELQERRDSRLTLVIGPAGSGKTTLISVWRQELVKAGRDVAWYNFGPEDDEAQFAAYVAASFAAAGLPTGPATPAFHDQPAEDPLNVLLPSLVNAIEDYEKPVHLVLEDLHYVASPAIDRFLERLIRLAPGNFHLVISSRSRPALALESLRARGDVAELNFTDLRFTVEETAAFLRLRNIRSLSMSDVGALHQLTDGWPAGLQLAAFSLRRKADPQTELKLMAAPSGLSRESTFDDYLREVVADSISEEELDVLTRLSACRRFNGELARIVTGNARAAELLQRFESEQLFISPIESEDDAPFFRFHRLFARFLQERLLQLPGDELRALNQRASEWFAGRRLFAEALRHAHYAENWELLAELLDRSARSFLKTSNFTQLLTWYERVPAALAGSRVNLLLCVGWAQLSVGREDGFSRTLAAIHQRQGDLGPTVQFEIRLIEALHLHMREDTAAMLERLEPFLANPPQTNDFNMLMLFDLVAGALVYGQQFERARDLVRHQRVLEIAERAGLPTPDIDINEGFSYLEQGNMPLARDTLIDVAHEAAKASILSLDLERRIGGFLAVAHYHLDEIEQAEALLTGCANLIRLAGVGPSVWFSFMILARIHDLKGKASAGLQLLLQFEQEAIARGRDRVTALCQAEIVRHHARHGQLLAAQEHLRRLDLVAGRYRTQRACAYADIPLAADMARVELLVASDDRKAALQLLLPLRDVVAAQGRQHYVAMLSLKAALASDRAPALILARDALNLAAQYNLRRLFADEGPGALELLGELVHQGDLPARHAQFAGTLEPVTDRAVAPAPVAQPNPLSPRELEILRLMDRSFSTKSIARALNLSVQTVKWYMKSLYAKLGAFSREGAIMQARKQGILSS